jgi:hypothetical protein
MTDFNEATARLLQNPDFTTFMHGIMAYAAANPAALGMTPSVQQVTKAMATAKAMGRIVNPCPPAKNITAVETTLFDNRHKSGSFSKGVPLYAFEIKLWVNESLNFSAPHYRAVSSLWTSISTRDKMDSLLARGCITQAGYDELMAMVEPYEADASVYVGHFFDKNNGTNYHDHEYALVFKNGTSFEAVIYLHGEMIFMPQFTDTTPKGNPLGFTSTGAKIERQSRLDRLKYATNWGTGDGDFSCDYEKIS